MNLKKIALASAIVGLASLGATQNANAIPLIQFAQTAGVNTVTGTNNGAGVTTVTGTNIVVSIAQIDAVAVTPFNAFLTLSATSTGVATSNSPGATSQNFNGSFTITSLAGGAGTNYLSGNFSNALLFGLTGGAQFSLGAAEPPQSLSFTSGVIPAADLNVARGLTFSFTNATPALGATAGAISSFSATVSGNASGNVQTSQVPEPASLLLLGTGLAAAARARRRKAATKA